TSFASQPIGGHTLHLPVAHSLSVLASATEWGLMLAAPIACCLFLTSLVIGIMARVAPQLNMMSFGFGLRIIAGLFSVLILWPDLVPRMNSILVRYSRFLIGY
ncbi:MAG: flagellar biosynthetic protein FliR, partial [Planctomycetes bacterium]|nr:flagellar biosynthetic protein FliR [Planctomycetota bacterium]